MTEKLELTEEQDFTITITDVRRAGHCPAGIRRWFESQGYDFRDFVKNGGSAKAFLDSGDGLARKVVTHAWKQRQETENGRG